jgi:hypothetical protein
VKKNGMGVCSTHDHGSPFVWGHTYSSPGERVVGGCGVVDGTHLLCLCQPSPVPYFSNSPTATRS